MAPEDVQVIGSELAIRWKQGGESFIPLERLRRGCPCAGCQGEGDIFGNISKPAQRPLGSNAFVLRGLERVGGYALQPAWADGHATGLFTWEYLQRLGEVSDAAGGAGI